MSAAQVIALSERTVVCCPRGSLDVATAPALRDVLLRAAEPGREVVLDLSAVTAFDASGLTVLVHAVRSVRRSGGSMRIIDARPHLAAMLSLIGVDRLLRVEVTGAARHGRVA